MCTEELQIIYINTPSQRGGAYSSLLKHGLPMMTSFQRVQHRRGRSELTVERPNKHCLGEAILINLLSYVILMASTLERT